MFSITYSLNENEIEIVGINPDHLSEVFKDKMVFATKEQAQFMHMIIGTIEAAVKDSYKKKFAVGIVGKGGEIVDITTETPLSKKQLSEISFKLDTTLELVPFINGYEFHTIG